MARTSKTVIGGDAEARTRALREASATGQASQQRASESLSGEYRASAQLKAQGGVAVGQSVAGYQDRQLQSDIATGQEIQQEADRELTAAVQGLEVVPGGLESPLLARRRAEMGEGEVMDEPGTTRLEGQEPRDEGAQYAEPAGPPAPGGQPGAAAGAPATAQAQMGPPPAVSQLQNPQQALQQAQTPVEQTRPGAYRATARAQQQERTALSAAQAEFAERQQEVDAKLLTADAAYLNAESKAGEAGEKARDNALKVMQSGMQTTKDQMSMLAEFPDRAAIMAGAFPGNPDIEMALEAGGGPGAKSNPQLEATVMRLLDNKLAMQNINYMATTGLSAPDYNGYNEIWQTFNLREAEMNAAFRGDTILGPLGGGDPTEGEPFRASVRAAGGAVDIDPVAEGNQGGAMRRAWAGFTGPHAFDQKQQFLRKATARAMVEAQELERQGQMGLKVSGTAQENISLKQEIVGKDAEIAQLRADLGYGPGSQLVAPGQNVTELPGGQRVPTSRAEPTQRRIEARAAGEPIKQTTGEEVEGVESAKRASKFEREEAWKRQHPGAY